MNNPTTEQQKPGIAEYLKAEVAKVKWYHTIDLGHGVITPGGDTRTIERFNEVFDDGVSFAGKTVLDIGAWDGGFSFECERRGAKRVLATDSFVWEMPKGKEGFLTARRLLNSKVEDFTIDVLELSPEKVGGAFDIVMCFGVLYHMRHPLLSLERAASVCGEMFLLNTQVDMVGFPRPAMAFYEGSELRGDPTNWAGPNPACIEGWLRTVGFKRIEQRRIYLWNSFDSDDSEVVEFCPPEPKNFREKVARWIAPPGTISYRTKPISQGHVVYYAWK